MKNLNRNKKDWYLLLLGFIFWLPVTAQKDTARKPAVVITSSFKPVLRTAYKINFSASHLPTDTTRARLTYNIPSQNLVYNYMPVVSKPLAL
ncbi:MAG: hypothetical protein ABIO05_03480, partial [Ferruginibacter sp.]